MLKMTIKAMMAAAALMGVALTANAQDYTIRATANSNESCRQNEVLRPSPSLA